jgi:hypothetical protein
MRTNTVDWRLIVGLIFILLLLFSRSPQTNLVLLAIGAGWFIQSGIAPFRGRGGMLGSTKVTYWRGERIVTRVPPRARLRSVSGIQLVVAVMYIVLGLSMAYAAVRLFIALV